MDEIDKNNLDWDVNEYPMNIILGYPKSSNFWTHYIVNTIAPKLQFLYAHGNTLNFWKYFDEKCVNFILLIRNYKECITRYIENPDFLTWEHYMIELKGKSSLETGHDATDYIANIKLYDSINKNKYLLYYEDMMVNPKDELYKLSNFLKTCSKENLDIDANDFINNYDKYRQISLSAYKSCLYTKGDKDKLFFHSQKLTKEFKIQLDNYIKENWNDLWEKYLKRYEEKEK